MYRIRVRNKDGDTRLVWKKSDASSRECRYYEDMSCTKELSTEEYSSVDTEFTGIPFDMFGIECGEGWYHLIEPIVKYIDDYNSKIDDTMKQIHITQIKEKYARLEIYVSYGTKELYDMIEKAGDESELTCEYCGTKENVGCTQGYYQTLCYDCIKDEVNRKDFGSCKWHSYDTDKVYWINPHIPDEYISTFEEYEKEKP